MFGHCIAKKNKSLKSLSVALPSRTAVVEVIAGAIWTRGKDVLINMLQQVLVIVVELETKIPDANWARECVNVTSVAAKDKCPRQGMGRGLKTMAT